MITVNIPSRANGREGPEKDKAYIVLYWLNHPCTTVNVPIMCTIKGKQLSLSHFSSSVGEILADTFMAMCFEGLELFEILYSHHLQIQLAEWLLLATFVSREV